MHGAKPSPGRCDLGTGVHGDITSSRFLTGTTPTHGDNGEEEETHRSQPWALQQI